MKIMTAVGTRPEFIQIAPVSRAIRAHGHTDLLVHTGQHYNPKMSDVFFEDLHLPLPDFHLGVGSGSHAAQTGQIMIHIEALMQEHQPDYVLVYGDTNSTVAAALTAAKLNIPVAHIEAGLRSFDRTMPEEINRIIVDHISDCLFAPTQTAVNNLAREGLNKNVFRVGDVRVDVLADVSEQARDALNALEAGVQARYGSSFALTTIHRASNTDDWMRLHAIVETLNALPLSVVIPVHPRLDKMLSQFGLRFSDNVHTIEPVGFLEMLALLKSCRVVITDSGGLQKEAYLLRRPAVTVRTSTEWVETVDAGWNRLCEPDLPMLSAALNAALQTPPADHPDLYGTYGVGERIVHMLQQLIPSDPAAKQSSAVRTR